MAKLDMVSIPSGRFVMGCVVEDKFANGHELPRVEVGVRAFEMSRHPVAEEEGGLPRVNVSWTEAG